MDKKLVESGQLIQILNQRIRVHQETAQCRITAISPMSGAAEGQPNWSSNVSFNANGMNRERALPVIRRIANLAQREYNLVERQAE